MKKTVTTFLFTALVLLFSTAFIVKDSNGKAGYAGSPGEQNCSACHGGGSSTTSGATITASPSFTNDAYIPGTVYTVSLTAQATGFSKFGFACEVLNSSNASIGVWQSPGTNVKLANAFNGRKNVTHTGIKTVTGNTVVFTFNWVAPAAGEGDAAFFYCVNAVNGTGSTNGDFPIPGSYTITEGVATVTTGISGNNNDLISQVSLFPNPASDNATVTYSLKESHSVSIELTDLNGKVIKNLSTENQKPGAYEKVISLQGVDKGVYFVRINSDAVKAAQKMLIVK